MAKFPVPEILRVPLENISLTVKVTRENEDVKVGIPVYSIGIPGLIKYRGSLHELSHHRKCWPWTRHGPHSRNSALQIRTENLQRQEDTWYEYDAFYPSVQSESHTLLKSTLPVDLRLAKVGVSHSRNRQTLDAGIDDGSRNCLPMPGTHIDHCRLSGVQAFVRKSHRQKRRSLSVSCNIFRYTHN